MEFPKKVREVKKDMINGEEYAASELLEKPGDFYYALAGNWPIRTPVINCPYCGVPTAYPQAKIINFHNEPLTVEGILTCAYSPKHRFKIAYNEIIPVTE